jgi:hypothetical protein
VRSIVLDVLGIDERDEDVDIEQETSHGNSSMS